MVDRPSGRADPDAATVALDGAAAAGDAASTSSRGSSMGSLLAQLAATPGPAPSAQPLAPGTVVDGVYEVGRVLGEGGMGVVHLARDRRLDREVALKVGRAVARAALGRIEREAIALARLNHPNVVVVHGVGETDGRLYIAMEYVPGGNAREWLRARPRTAREIVAMYAAAGDGLAAAHRAGLVHRDFKPDNVLVGDDGRPRVADFGLVRAQPSTSAITRGGGGAAARADADAATDADGDVTADAAAGALDATAAGALDTTAPGERMTMTGAVVGTPAYMAPEQLAGETVDERADQFAYCASVWEALTGARPFPGTTPEQIARAIERGRPVVDGALAVRGVPRHVLAALRRGLAVAPADRWPSMAALVAALRRDPAARRRRIAAGALALGAVAAAVVAPRLGGSDDAVCATGARGIAAAWSPARAGEVRVALTAAGGAWSGPAADRAIAALDELARRWSLRYREVCAAGDDALAPALRRRGLECLRATRDQLAAAAAALARPDPHAAARADAVIAAVDGPDRCADAAYLAHRVAGPAEPRRAAAVAALDRAISVADAEVDAGRGTAVAPLLATLAAVGRGDGAPASAGRAGLALGKALDLGEEVARAIPILRAAYRDAAAAGDDELAGHVAARLAMIHAGAKHTDEAEDWIEIATADDARGGDAARDQLALVQAAIIVASERHDLAGALALAERALAAAPSPGLARAAALRMRAEVLDEVGERARGLADHQAALALIEREVGRDHPQTIDVRVRIAFDLGELGRDDEAIAVERDVIALGEASGQPEYRAAVADAYNALGATLTRRGALDDAVAALHHAVDGELAAQGPLGPDLASALNNLGLAYAAQGRRDEARDAYRRALAIAEDPRDDDLGLVAIVLGNLAVLDRLAGRDADAEAEARRAVEIDDRVAPGSADEAAALTALGATLVARGDLTGARAALERAVAVHERAGAAAAAVAESRGWLAIVRARQGDRAAARALAAAARPALGDGQVSLAAALDALLAGR